MKDRFKFQLMQLPQVGNLYVSDYATLNEME
jgi:hypothetical protein